MKTGKKVLLSLVMSAAMTLTAFTNLFPQTVYSANEAVAAFKDVPANSYAYKDINDLRALGITNGIGNNLFGYNQPVTRAEFITFLCRLMKWEYVSPSIGSFSDNMDKSKYYYSPIETALSKGAITTAEKAFRPEEPATREEMAIMLVRCLGYDALAKRLAYLGAPFSDVSQNTGYITIARDFGIISGTGKGFNPEGKAMKEQAAAMMMRMYNRLNTPVSGLNAFYAIKSSGQAAFVQDLDSLCCGWSSLEYDQDAGKVFINTARSINGTLKDFYLPQGFAGVTGTARSKGVPALLMVYGSQLNKIVPAGASSTADSSAATGMMDFLLKDSGRTDELISEIAEAVSNSSRIAADGSASESSSFDGVVVDFEYMKGTELKTAFTAFLQKLRNKLPEGTLLYVTVHPAVSRNRTYFDAYDFKKIGEIADKVILMAHDYDPTSLSQSDMASGFSGSPGAPAEEVYYALQQITDTSTGIADRSKIMLQISFAWTEWLTRDGKTVKSTPGSYSMENFLKLFSANVTSIKYSELYKCPYLEFSDTDGIKHTVWYEDSRSIEAKYKMAQLFNIHSISIWRLGNIPEFSAPSGSDTYQQVWTKIKQLSGRL